MMADWDVALTQIEEQSRKMLEKHILGDGGNPKSNSVVAIVNHHVGEARNALQGSMD